MKEKYIYLYYLALLFVFVSWTDPNSSPAMIVRVAFMAVLFIPVLFLDHSWFPAVFTCFLTIAQYGIAYSYLPDSISIYMWLVLAFCILYRKKRRLPLFPTTLMYLTGYVLFVDLMSSSNIYHIFYTLVIASVFSALFNENYMVTTKRMSWAFIVVTVVLCYYFIFFKDAFSVSLGKYDTDLERVSWTDPNYLGCVIGMGILCSAFKISELKEKRYLITIFLCIIALAVVVLIMNASRGALLAVMGSMVYFLYVSRYKVIYKILLTGLVVVFLFTLYNNSYFDLLEYRIQSDETGSGRSEIWIDRLNAFFAGSPLKILVGYGREGCMTLGTSISIGNHNDYIAFLVEYGVIGFILFIRTLLYPLEKIMKTGGGSTIVVASTIYLALCCLTLEPFTLGRIPYYMFYLYIILVINNKNKKINENSNIILRRSV